MPARASLTGRAGVTLIEMLVVVTIIGLMLGVAMPSFSAGLDGLRLRTSADSVASALNIAVRTAERRQLPVELAIQSSENRLVMRVGDSPRTHTYSISSGIRIARVLPALYLGEDKRDRYLIVYPNGAPPQLLVELETARGAKKYVRLDPITGTARVTDRMSGAGDATK